VGQARLLCMLWFRYNENERNTVLVVAPLLCQGCRIGMTMLPLKDLRLQLHGRSMAKGEQQSITRPTSS